ncbi:MAG: helix-turn-helix domain-containing protein [Phycisphaerae bacterium]|nr:helix-turn-helix domain-containing protein [Phycisphaerae bacterium]
MDSSSDIQEPGVVAVQRTESRALLTADEIARQLKVTTEQVRSLIRRGELAAINVGTGRKQPLYRVTPQAFDEFLARRFQAGPATRRLRVKRRRPVRDHFPDIR